MTFGRCADFCVGGGLDAFPAPGWCDQPAPAMVRREYAVVACEVDPRLRHQRRQCFLAGVVLLCWIPSQRTEAMSQVVLWSVVPGVAGRGCSVPFYQDEPEFYR